MHLFLVMIAIVSIAYIEISKLKAQITQLQKQVNELCRLTNHEQLSCYTISDELKELALHLKNSGKETEAVKKIREATAMPLIEAKQYVDRL